MASQDETPHQQSSGHSKPSQQQELSNPPNAQSTQLQAVRFASVNQEYSLQSFITPPSQTPASDQGGPELNADAEEDLRNLSKSLQSSHLQQRRMSNFAFEPVSLPASRVPSTEPSSHHASREATRSGTNSPKPSAPSPSKLTPPLTPASSHSRSAQRDVSESSDIRPLKAHSDAATGSQQFPQVVAPDGGADRSLASSTATSRPSSVSDQVSSGPTTLSQPSTDANVASKNPPAFLIGVSESSKGVESPREASISTLGGRSGSQTPPSVHDKVFNPVGDRDDPYARSKRPPQPKNLDSIDQRFVFGAKDPRRRSAFVSAPASAASSSSLPRSSSGGDLKAQNDHKSSFSLHSLGGKKDHFGHLHDENHSSSAGKPHGSMSDLKRFFGIGHKSKRSQSPSASAKASASSSGTKTPPHQLPPSNVPFADDHGLQTKYGKFGKVLGSGAGGSVRLMKRSSDGVTFAVKQFRDRHPYESERDYAKKVTAEFCIGSTLHHGNIIETLDIVNERGKWYEVMEYAPYDLFAIVMTGKMSREEVACCFLQIVSGVRFLHSMGLAHRDLKLDNVVVNEHGIMKIIDFGSASVFQYPFENDIVLASGIVGSDPYLAPEVYDVSKYDPRPTDIWSLAIIFACMSLRRFPWKAPRISDNSYKLFISAPHPGAQTNDAGLGRSIEAKSKPASDVIVQGEDARPSSASTSVQAPDQHPDEGLAKPHHHHHHHHPNNMDQTSTVEPSASTAKEVIRGPWRLLRLLPRESRPIISRMLEIPPRNRATMDDLMKDSWITTTPVCSQTEGGKILRAPGHEHTLEPSSAKESSTSHK